MFLTGLSEGLLPTALAETPDAIAEERRLLYVGVTRAREHLQLSYARSRLPGGRPNRRASRFLEGLWPGSSPRAAARRQDAEEDPRTTLTTAVLLRWREQRAAELGVAPGRVLATHVLHAVAQRRPGTRAELAQVPGIGAQTLARLGDDIVAAVLDATGAPARPRAR